MKKRDKSYLKNIYLIILLSLFIVISFIEPVATAKNASSTAQYAYVPNEDNNVYVIDTATNTVIATVEVGDEPWGVAFSQDGTRVYVTNRVDDTVSIIDTSTNTCIGAVKVGSVPSGIAVTPDGTKVYVTHYSDVSIIDTATNTVTTLKNVGKGLIGVVITPDGKKVYIADNPVGAVYVIDTATNTITTTVKMDSAMGIAVASDGTKVYVTNEGSNTVSIIDTATNTVAATVDVGYGPYEVAVTPDGNKAYVTDGTNVSVIDTATNYVTTIGNVCDNPYGVAVTPDGTKAYVTDFIENDISVIDTATDTVTANINIGKGYGNPSFGQFIGTCPSSAVETATPQQTTDQVPSILDTMTAIDSSNDQYILGQPITLNALVETTSQDTKQPSGIVIFMDRTTCIGTEYVIFGRATLTTSSLSPGSHSITAKYSGDNNFKSSISSAYTLTVVNKSSIEILPSPESQPSSEQQTSTKQQTNSEVTSNFMSIISGTIATVVGGIILLKYEKRQK